MLIGSQKPHSCLWCQVLTRRLNVNFLLPRQLPQARSCWLLSNLFARGGIFEPSHFLPDQQEVEMLITACPQQIPGAAELPPASGISILIVWDFWYSVAG